MPVGNGEDDGKGSFVPGLASLCMGLPGAGDDPLPWGGSPLTISLGDDPLPKD